MLFVRLHIAGLISGNMTMNHELKLLLLLVVSNWAASVPVVEKDGELC